ncbi:MAG: neutral zinc metallopeptidase [Planctomycetales bacterium]|nr:neutral zinc metallopeptidase [Planctomycetales bacterium]
MRWKEGRRSENVEDRRALGGGAIAAGGGLGAIVLALLVLFMGGDPQRAMNIATGGGQQQTQPKATNPEEDELADFVKVVLGDTEDVWKELFAQQGVQYREPKLVLFTGSVQSGCGRAGAEVGPFYCPADETVYIDLGFYRDLKSKLGAPGDFAQAYVIAHEVGHHIQNLLGLSDAVHAQQQRLPQAEYNKLSVMLELQADFLAGVWAHHAHRQRNILERGDIEEALTAAAAIGDDTLQENASGRVRPETFTHGTSAERVKWFSLGLKTGDVRQGDTGIGPPIYRGN